MTGTGRKIGANVAMLMQEVNMSAEKLAERLNFTIRDVYRLIEGRLLLSPKALQRVADVLGKTTDELMFYETNHVLPELQYMKEFSDPANLEKVLDLLDEYIELKESL